MVYIQEDELVQSSFHDVILFLSPAVQVPILRNRQRKLVFIETPWDTFGPEPPPTFDYSQRLESAPDAD